MSPVECRLKRRFTGIISKRVDGVDHAGHGDPWRKSKSISSVALAVVAYMQPNGSRSRFRAVLFAMATDKVSHPRGLGRG